MNEKNFQFISWKQTDQKLFLKFKYINDRKLQLQDIGAKITEHSLTLCLFMYSLKPINLTLSHFEHRIINKIEKTELQGMFLIVTLKKKVVQKWNNLFQEQEDLCQFQNFLHTKSINKSQSSLSQIQNIDKEIALFQQNICVIDDKKKTQTQNKSQMKKSICVSKSPIKQPVKQQLKQQQTKSPIKQSSNFKQREISNTKTIKQNQEQNENQDLNKNTVQNLIKQIQSLKQELETEKQLRLKAEQQLQKMVKQNNSSSKNQKVYI